MVSKCSKPKECHYRKIYKIKKTTKFKKKSAWIYLYISEFENMEY